jgi:hypothetical protein
MAMPAQPVPAVDLGGALVAVAVGAVLFVVVITVCAVLLFLLQAVLPHGDTSAEPALAEDQPGDDEVSAEEKRNQATGT